MSEFFQPETDADRLKIKNLVGLMQPDGTIDLRTPYLTTAYVPDRDAEIASLKAELAALKGEKEMNERIERLEVMGIVVPPKEPAGIVTL